MSAAWSERKFFIHTRRIVERLCELRAKEISIPFSKPVHRDPEGAFFHLQIARRLCVWNGGLAEHQETLGFLEHIAPVGGDPLFAQNLEANAANGSRAEGKEGFEQGVEESV